MSVNQHDNSKQITRTYLTGSKSTTLVIPKKLATAYGLDNPSHVILEPRSNGILIKKLKL